MSNEEKESPKQPFIVVNPGGYNTDEELRRWCTEMVIKTIGNSQLPASVIIDESERIFNYIRNGKENATTLDNETNQTS